MRMCWAVPCRLVLVDTGQSHSSELSLLAVWLLRGWGGVLPDSIVQSKRFFPSSFVLLWSSKCGPPEYNGRGCEPGPGPAAPWDRLLSCSELQFALLLDGVNAPHLPHKSCAANKMGYVSASPWNLGILKP